MASSKSKSKSREKSSSRAGKEQQKASSKPSGSTNSGNGVNAYNPTSGTFLTKETSSVASSPPSHENGHFQNIDDTDDHSCSPNGTVSEYDSVSNNGSCSGESEDPKDKTANCTPRQDIIPGSDNDRQEKIRLKNERKHQRQRERRAQELHERCSGYLMSRKLEILTQQLVPMGFPSERATLALILNEGRVEDSVSWLVSNEEESHDDKDTNIGNGGNLKIDISEELARISAIEAMYKCSKQEVERAVVSCDGDLEKAEESIKVQKQEKAATASQQESADDNNLKRSQDKPMGPVIIQQRRHERDFNYTKPTTAPAPAPTYNESGIRNPQSSKIYQPRSVPDKRFVTTGSGPSVSLPVTPIMPGAPSSAKPEPRQEGKNIQVGAMREPVIVMQRPQSINAKHNPVSSASPPGVGWYQNNNIPGGESVRLHGKTSMETLAPENQGCGQLYRQSAGYGGGSWSASHPVSPEPRGLWSNTSTSLTVPSSLGLFLGWSSGGTLGAVDWNTRGGSMPEFDYTSVDWTLDSKTKGVWAPMRVEGMQDGVGAETAAREWTSAFAGKDMFSIPRQIVTSPSP